MSLWSLILLRDRKLYLHRIYTFFILQSIYWSPWVMYFSGHSLLASCSRSIFLSSFNAELYRLHRAPALCFWLDLAKGTYQKEIRRKKKEFEAFIPFSSLLADGRLYSRGWVSVFCEVGISYTCGLTECIIAVANFTIPCCPSSILLSFVNSPCYMLFNCCFKIFMSFLSVPD